MRIKHIIGTIVVFAVALVCVRLGFWQLERLDQKRSYNRTLATQAALPPSDISALSNDPRAAAYRRATATGEYVPEEEVLLYGRTRDEQPGSHVLTPLRLEDGSVLLVDRGWIPATMDRTPVADAPPPRGRVTVAGTARASPSTGGEELENPTIVRTIDLGQLDAAIEGELLPIYLQLTPTEPPDALPYPEPLPPLEDGPHLGYAGQWFLFAAVALIGWVLLVRRDRREERTGERREERTPAGNDPSI